jgi:hypothetical protein
MFDHRLTKPEFREGPLVTTTNATVRSDLRLYTSDNNATVRESVHIIQKLLFFDQELAL